MLWTTTAAAPTPTSKQRHVALFRVDDEGEDGDRREQPGRQPAEDGVDRDRAAIADDRADGR